MEYRNRLLASPVFQAWATRFPLTRPIARHRAAALFDLCAGFVYSQVLLACVQLNVFGILATGARPLPELAERLRLAPDRAARLLDAAVALHLLERRSPGTYALGPLGAALAGNPGVAAMIEHHTRLYADLADPLALLRGQVGNTALAGYWPYAIAQDPAELRTTDIAAYSALMAASQPMISAEALGAYSMRRHRCLLDVGGGDGVFLEQVAERWPHLSLMLFDLPPVAARAGRRLGDRASCIGGDFRRDPLPAGADLISLVRILHDHDDGTVLTLLAAARRALEPGGQLLVVEPMSGLPGSIADAYFGFYLLAMGSGRPRSPAVLTNLLQRAGFRKVRLLRTAQPLLAGAMLATL